MSAERSLGPNPRGQAQAMNDRFDHYEAISEASGAMVAAARAGDWEALATAERECGRAIAALREASAARALKPAEAQRKVSLFRKVLADDAEIRDITHPSFRRLEHLLGGKREAA